jgi:hypothetical protein
LYGAFLQSGDDELLLSGRVRGSGLPLHRPPCGREGDGCYDSWGKIALFISRCYCRYSGRYSGAIVVL